MTQYEKFEVVENILREARKRMAGAEAGDCAEYEQLSDVLEGVADAAVSDVRNILRQ